MTSLNRPQRLSPFSIVFFILKTIRVNWTLIPVGYVMLKDEDFSTVTFFLAVIGVSILLILFAYLRYYHFKYSIQGEELHIDSGVFSKKSKNIPFHRIQSVNIEQSLIFRLVNLVTLSIDTAGSSVDEVKLPGITKALAEEMKQSIHTEKTPISTEETVHEAPQLKNLLTLSFPDFFRIGIGSNRIYIALAAVYAFYNSVAEQAESFFGIDVVLKMGKLAENTLESGWSMWFFLVIIGLVAIITLSVFGAVFSYYNYRLTYDGNIFRSRAGLFTKREEQILHEKVQTLHYHQNWIMKLMKRRQIILKQASASSLDVDDSMKSKSSFVIPIADHAFEKEIKQIVFPDLLFEDIKHIHRSFLTKHFIHFFAVPITLLIGVALYFLSFWGFLLLPLYGISYFILKRIYKNYRVGYTPSHFFFEYGFIGKNTMIFEAHRIQQVKLIQTPFQRRKKVASIRFGLPSGSVTVPYLPLAEARFICDYYLFVVETSKEEWI